MNVAARPAPMPQPHVGRAPVVALRPRLFTRPWPVFAAVILAVNDHLLKGAGLLPGWLTGKLSDFAGLFFAPLLLAELWLLLWPARTAHGVWRRAAWSAGGVGAGFCAIKLSAGASALWERGLGGLGVPSSNVVDPTDLLALPMLLWALVTVRRLRAGV